ADHALPAAERVPLSPERLAEIFFELEAQGAHNINLVTPEHFVPLLIPALREAKMNGLSIPVVYNTGSYEKVEAVRALEGLVDIWLPDLKYMSPALAASHTGAPDYFRHASAAIAEMVRQCPEPVFSDGSHAIDCADDADDPLMTRGVLVRHLALPGCAEDSRAILRYLRETYGNRIFISLLNQYTPMPKAPGSLARRLSESEYDALVSYAIEIGIENGFVQESGTVSSSYIPVFDGTGI
ncbi:MAG: radical SAM protein, partial [Eubacteriales bacterium]|nr:radical SAM protein [Eubacteriales bacterium]